MMCSNTRYHDLEINHTKNIGQVGPLTITPMLFCLRGNSAAVTKKISNMTYKALERPTIAINIRKINKLAEIFLVTKKHTMFTPFAKPHVWLLNLFGLL